MEYLAPKQKTVHLYGDEVIESSHDAFGMISMSIVTGGSDTLFGSDLKHGQQVRICIKRAVLERRNSNDHFFARDDLVEVSLSHTQFAEMITSPNRGDGIPCTINYAPEPGTFCKYMPGIKNVESKAQIMRDEIRNSAKEQMEKMAGSMAKIEQMLEDGTGGKKALKAELFSLKAHINNTPLNMAFVVEKSERALEKAVTSAKIDVEAYINSAINNLGLEAARNLGLTEHTAQGFLTNEH